METKEERTNGQLLSIWIAAFLSAFDTTVGTSRSHQQDMIVLIKLVATLLGAISSDFNEANKASWLGTA